MKTQTENTTTAAPAELIPAEPIVITPATMSAPRSQFTLVQLTTAGNNLTRGLVTSAQQMLRLQVSMLHSVAAMGFILGEARRLHFGDFTKLFPKKQGDEIKPGMFACSRTTAHNYIRTAEAIWQRAAAAGKAASLAWTAQDRAAFWELPLAYVAAIVADKFKRPDATRARSWNELLDPLDAGQMKQLVYTIEARGRRREKKAAEKLNLPAPAEVHISRSTMPPQRLADWRGDVLATPAPAAKPKRKGRKHAPVCQP